MLVILDNGHGKETPGKRSPKWEDGSQLFEWEFNRSIVNRVSYFLELEGIKTHILVLEDNDVSLIERVKRVNRIKEDSILISIHGNAGGGTGFEGFTTTGQTKSDKLCDYIYEAFKSNIPQWKLRTDKTDGDSDKEKNFTIIYSVWMPATLLECGFMDNYEDCQFMLSENGRRLISKSIFEGIKNYIKM